VQAFAVGEHIAEPIPDRYGAESLEATRLGHTGNG
jgi:hypothetical protein